MDLSQYDPKPLADKGVTMTLRHPATHEDLMEKDEPVTITLAGRDSSEYQAAAKLLTNRRLNKTITEGRTVVTADEVDNDTLDVLVRCTKSWQNVGYKGEVIECLPSNVRLVYTELRWVREQVDAFISNRANFLGN